MDNIITAETPEAYGFIGDNYYTDDFLADYIHSFISNGVYADDLAVVPAGGLRIALQPGRAWINGYYYHLNNAPKYFDAERPDTALGRVDAVILYLDRTTLTMGTELRRGEYSSNPQPPALVRNSLRWELMLCKINIGANITEISSDAIYDTRLDDGLCGLVYCPVEHVDATELLSGLYDAKNAANDAAQLAQAATANANKAAEDAEDAAAAAWEAAQGMTVVIDPTTGTQQSIQDTFFDIYNYFIGMIGSPITVSDFDDLNLTVSEFEAYNMTVNEFNTRAKLILT